MQVVFRVDASFQIGTGHVMRCLTLAKALQQKNADVKFICREHQGNLINYIEQQGFKTYRLPTNVQKIESIEPASKREIFYGVSWLGSTQEQDAEQCLPILSEVPPDWLIVDHYGMDQLWEASLKECYKKIMVIDDLVDRQHQCDVLLDQTYGRKKGDYLNFVPKNCQLLLGSQYALLRPEFSEWREFSLRRRIKPQFKKLLITLGGVDSNNVTSQVLEALEDCELPIDLEITVVMGVTSPYKELVQEQAEKMSYKTEVKINVTNMAELMANSDVAIGAAGATTWERCCLGVPSLIILLADNQKETIEVLVESAIALKGSTDNLNKDMKKLENISGDLLMSLSQNTMKVLDGQGTNKVMNTLLGRYQ